ncbi:hypothetical protein CF326_g1107 [Tilletia indica]|nr:hypothetical protein CF326_g1107 [Tilletia indica]
MRTLILPIVFLSVLGSHAVPVAHKSVLSAPSSRDVTREGAGIISSGDVAASRDLNTAGADWSYPAEQLAARELFYASGNGLALPFVDRASLDEAGDLFDGVSSNEASLADVIQLRQSSYDFSPDFGLTPHLSAHVRDPSPSLPDYDQGLPEADDFLDNVSSNGDSLADTVEARDISYEEIDGALHEKRIVYNPKITYPNHNTVWQAGDEVHVNWRTAEIPQTYESHQGSIMLGYRPSNGEGGLNLHRTLVSHFSIMDGSISFKLPDNLPTRNDYIVVLFGDSGNASPLFTIRGRQNQLVQMLGVGTDSEYQEGLIHPLMYKAKEAKQPSPTVGPGVEGQTLEGIIKSNSNGLLL